MLELSFGYNEEASQAVFKSRADATCHQINMNNETCSHAGIHGQQRLQRYRSNTVLAKSKGPSLRTYSKRRATVEKISESYSYWRNLENDAHSHQEYVALQPPFSMTFQKRELKMVEEPSERNYRR